MVIYNNKGELLVSFLTNNGILSRIARRRNCDTIRNIILPNTNSYIQLINQKAILKQIAFKEDIKLIPYESIKNIKFIHSKEIIDNFDLLSEVEMLKEENFVTDSLSEPNVLKNENKQAISTNATRIFESSTIRMFTNYKNKNKNKRKNKNKKKNKSEKTEVKESESLNEIKINEVNNTAPEEVMLTNIDDIIQIERNNLFKYRVELEND
ncbi:hypothetical protein BpHYR1_010380 [Brachionus plicatilis]|uniref:Uncharacterized protein n=1 Tax=Brachionus plicatilis TaxID=10195 RepID=A0A3M7SVP3_BRAPC|nr:hypothetical protein BpHYR1_010380 [Brachionus plicatilis]